MGLWLDRRECFVLFGHGCLGFGFCYWVFFHFSLFVLGVCVDGGKRIGLLLVLLKMD